MTVRQLAGHDIFVTRAGEGGEPAVMAHCALASHRACLPVTERLSDLMTFSLFDMPGHGRSGPLDPEAFMQATVAEVIRTLAGETGGPVHVLGHSFGATAALRAVATTPEIARSLTLIDPVWFEAARGTAAFEDHVRVMEPFASAAREGEIARAAREFMAVWSEVPLDRVPQAEREKLLARFPTVARGEADLYTDPLGLFEPGGLEAVACPVALIDGSRSPAVVGAICAALARLLPQARRTTVDGAGHMVPITHADAVADAIREMIAG